MRANTTRGVASIDRPPKRTQTNFSLVQDQWRPTQRSLLRVPGLVELDLEVARNFEEGNEPVAVVLNFLCELHPACPEFADGPGDVVAVEGNIGSSRCGVVGLCTAASKSTLR